MEVDSSKKNKVSLIVSSMLLGMVSLHSDDIILTHNYDNGIYESVLNNKNIENNGKISSNINVTNQNININAIEIGDAKSSTIINKGVIDLKASNTNEYLTSNGIVIGDTDVYYGEEDEVLPSKEMIDIKIINDKTINTSVYSDKMAETSGFIAYGVHLNNEIINNDNISTYAESLDDALASGIKVGDLFSSSIINKGTIESISKGNKISTAFGISAVSSKNSTFLNSGIIFTNAESQDGEAVSVATEFWGTYKDEEYSLIDTEYTNDGTIKAVSKANDAQSLGFVADQPIVGSTIVNNGIILSEAKGLNKAYSNGFLITDTFSESTFTNNGKISVSADGLDSNAEAIELTNVNDSEIINKGIIEAFVFNNSTNDDATGIFFENVLNSNIKNDGTIITNSNAYYSLSKGINPGYFYNSTIINSGTIKSTMNNSLDEKGMAINLDFIDTTSSITNTKSGKIYGNILLTTNNADVGDAKFINEGFISLPYNANKNSLFSFEYEDENGKKITETASLRPYLANLTNSGIIEIGAFKNSSGNIENTQILTKNATFEKGSKMQVNVVSGSKAFNLGDTLAEVIKSTNKLTVNELSLNQTILADNSATLDFKYEIIDDKQIDLVVSKVNKISDVIIEDKENNQNITNTASIGDLLDNLRDNPLMGGLISNIDAMSTSNEVSEAINSITPTTVASLINTSSQINKSISDVVSTRLGNINMGMNSGDDMNIDNNKVWIKAYGGLGKQRDKDDISGFDLKTYGVGIGYDKEYQDDQFIGLATFYTRANTKTNNINHENDIDAYSIVAYGSNTFPNKKTKVYYQTAHTWQRNDSKREIFSGERADSKFTSKVFFADLKVGHKIDLSDSVSIEPNMGVAYSHFTNPSYKEKGAGALNIQSDKFTSSKIVGKLGTTLEYEVNEDSKLTLSLGAGYNFKDNDRNIISSFEGAPNAVFDTKGIDNGRWEYEAGLGYAINLDEQNNFNISYKYLGEGNKYNNNTLTLNYNYKF